MRTSITLFLSPLPASDLIPVSPLNFPSSFLSVIFGHSSNVKCHLFWSQGVSQLQGDGVMDAWNNVKILGEKFWFDDNFAIIYSNFKPRQINCFKPFCFGSPFVSSLPHRASFLFFSSEDINISLLGFLLSLEWREYSCVGRGEEIPEMKNGNEQFWF